MEYPEQKIKRLSNELRGNKYSGDEYEMKLIELEMLERKYPIFVKDDSPTKRVR